MTTCFHWYQDVEMDVDAVLLELELARFVAMQVEGLLVEALVALVHVLLLLKCRPTILHLRNDPPIVIPAPQPNSPLEPVNSPPFN